MPIEFVIRISTASKWNATDITSALANFCKRTPRISSHLLSLFLAHRSFFFPNTSPLSPFYRSSFDLSFHSIATWTSILSLSMIPPLLPLCQLPSFLNLQVFHFLLFILSLVLFWHYSSHPCTTLSPLSASCNCLPTLFFITATLKKWIV